MKLPIKLPFQKQPDTEYYLSLLLSDEKTHATVFTEKTGKVAIIGEHEEHFHSPIEKLSDENLLDILDKTISNAESKLPNGFQTRKTIFGVKENWIDDTKIKKEYLSKLKKVCDSLGLQPIGFLVIHEAIAHLLQQEEGAPVSAILAEIGSDTVALSILRAGKILETKRVPIHESIAKTIDKTLISFTSYEILPSRIVVFDGKIPEKLSQELITHHWSKSLPFLHVPQIKILPKQFQPRAILFGAATQMGFEVIDKFDMPTIPEQSSEVTPEEEDPEPSIEQTEVGEEAMFGFVTDKDIAKIEKPAAPPSPITAVSPNDPVETFNQEFFEAEHESEQVEHKNHTSWQKKVTHVLTAIKKPFHSLSTKISFEKLTHRFPVFSQRKGLIFIPPLIIGVILIIVLLYIFMLKATVILHIEPKTVQQDQVITFSINQASNPAEHIIAAESVATTEEGSVSTAATGKKEIGEKAKGSITLYNSATKEQSIAKGSVISTANLQFILDDTIKIASSGGASDGSKTAKGNVTAKDIGKEFNLPSGTKFTISGFSPSEVEAKNDSAFSGGSKKEITVVAKADTAKLLDELPKKLQEKAKEKLQSSITNNKTLLPLFLTTSVEKKIFDKSVGEEASSVSLDGTVSFTSAAYSKQDLETYAYDLLSTENNNLTPSKDSLSYTLKETSDNDGDITAKANIKGYLLPKIEKEDIKQTVSGKSFDDAKSSLSSLPQIKQVEILLNPALPFLPSLLPRISTNITIETKINE